MLKEIPYINNFALHLGVYNIQEYPWHFHSDMQVIYIVKGTVTIKVSQLWKDMKKGDVQIIHPGDIHGFNNGSEDNEILIISLSTDYFKKIFSDFENNIYTTELDGSYYDDQKKYKLCNFMIQILHLYTMELKDSYKKINETSLEFVEFLRKNFRGYLLTDNHLLKNRAEVDIHQEDRVRRITEYMYENYKSKITLEQIAEMENISKYYLSHLITRLVGHSFREMLSYTRIEMSEYLVLTTDDSFSKISSSVGFSHLAYFNKYFEMFFSCTPLKYREMYKGKIIGKAEPKSKEITSIVSGNIEKYLPHNFIPLFNRVETQIGIKYNEETNGTQRDDAISCNKEQFSIPTLDLKKDLELITFNEKISNRTRVPENYNSILSYNEAVSFLSGLNEHKRVNLYDSSENSNGLITYNGLKKPAFHVYDFLSKMTCPLIFIDEFCVISRNKDLKVIAYNNNEHPITININFDFVEKAKTATVSRMSNKWTCFSLWMELEFKPLLSAEEVRIINEHSLPQVSFHRIKEKQKICSYNINPEEMIFMKIEED